MKLSSLVVLDLTHKGKRKLHLSATFDCLMTIYDEMIVSKNHTLKLKYGRKPHTFFSDCYSKKIVYLILSFP